MKTSTNIIFWAIWVSLVISVIFSTAASVFTISGNAKQARIEKEIVAALEENTEDQGTYVIALMPAHDNLPENYGTFYYAIMADDDEDYTLYAIRYLGKYDIEIYTVETFS